MSQYTTGELAKACGVTVRTVQYYDARGILTPSALSEGGRRLYSEDDLKTMKIICFLREIGLSIDTIGKLLAEDHPGSVISLLLEQQEKDLREEIGTLEEQLEKVKELKKGVADNESFTVESIGDIAYTMASKKNLRNVRLTMLLSAIPLAALEVGGILLWIFKGLWWVFLIYLIAAIPWSIVISRYYYKKVAYICPECHTVFKPKFKEMFFARHTPKTRRLTCTQCGHHGYCVEVYDETAKKTETP